MPFEVMIGDATATSIASHSVDLIVTSPPYLGLRTYSGEVGEIGAEASQQEYLDALLLATAEMVRVLKPTGSIFVNLADRYIDGALQLLPYRYALVVQNQLGLMLRSEVIWHKPNGIPENQRNRHRRSHEVWFHLACSKNYYSDGYALLDGNSVMPSSVQTYAPRPYPVLNGVEHPAAFSVEWPKQFILGWSPIGWCDECGEAVRSTASKTAAGVTGRARRRLPGYRDPGGMGVRGVQYMVDGVVCGCSDGPGELWESVVLDPFGGSGTTAHVASALDRHGVSLDLNPEYAALAWDSDLAESRFRMVHGFQAAPVQTPGQESLFEVL